MQALKKFSVVITFAAFSFSGSAAWAADSFVAKAELNGFEVVPPVLTATTAEVTLPFRITQPTTEGTIALVLNPWIIKTRVPGDNIDVFPVNFRLYFGQHFANGLPIATLCDNDIPKLKCPEPSSSEDEDEFVEIFEATEEFELRDIQFQEQQVANPGDFQSKTIAGVRIEKFTPDRRLPNDESGLKALKALIKLGLIYVVINSDFKANLNKAGDIIGYRPPAPDPTNRPRANVKQRDLTTQFRDLFRIVDGDLRGTLCLVSKKNDSCLP